MTYYSTCKQLSFGRRNLGRPTMACDASMRQIRPPEALRQHEVQRRSRSVSAKRYKHLFPKSSVHPLQLDVTDERTYLSAVRAHLSTREGAYKRFVHLIQRMKNASAKARKDFGFEETFKKIVALLGNNMELVRHLHFVLPSCYLFQMQKDAIIVKELQATTPQLHFQPTRTRPRSQPCS